MEGLGNKDLQDDELNDKELMCMVLKSAINDYLRYPPKRPEYEHAFEWLFTDFDESENDKIEDVRNGFISLFTACDLLELNYEKLRVLIKCKEDQGKRRLVESQFNEIFNSCKLEGF
jgi:hypothetical protein